MEYSYLVLIPLIAGIGEAIRLTGVPCRYIPFINLVIGLALGMILCSTNSKACIVIGLYTGLSASGLVKSTRELGNCLNARSPCNKKDRHYTKRRRDNYFEEIFRELEKDYQSHNNTNDEFEDDD
ncbi:hypothetical protein [Vallitalea guaymasensis]|uniref:hypothetical protein n=1 Tax=Vallitalea guaymasensis TaxID=1185412 RepID=UPI00272D4340|nr:hypothetical protein [Vallitalea guaymasensis]